MKSISVVGSLNIDHTLTVEKLPNFGETISSINYEISEGGKGANQAVAIGKLGIKTLMFGKIGNDDFGQLLVKSLKTSDVNTDGVIIDQKIKTGCAFITVDRNGNNTIVLNSGANGCLKLEELKKIEDSIFTSDILLLQMEIPKELIRYLIESASELKKIILLNLAPAMDVGTDMLNKVDYLIINETEMEFLTNIKFSGNNLGTEIIELRKFYRNNLIITLGPLGAAYSIKDFNYKILSTFDVITKDKTAAGDAFIGGFIYGLVNDNDIQTCVILGNANGSISTTIRGAQKSLPNKEQLNNFLLKNNLEVT
ncbi:MAG: ribokinase [Candidatus Humimicrobiaceae bacterium]